MEAAQVRSVKPSAVFGSTEFRFGGRVHSLEYSPHGTRLLSAGGQWGAALWDAATGKLLRHFSTNEWRSNTNASFSKHGRFVAIAGDYQTPVPIWNSETGELIRVIEQGAKAVRFSPDAQSVFTVFEHTLSGFQVSTGERLARLAADAQPISRIAVSNEGSLVAATTENPSFEVNSAGTIQE